MSEAKEYNPLEHSVVQGLLKADATHRYEVSDFVEALLFRIKSELERVYWNTHQEDLNNREDWQFLEIPGFEYRRYFWDDCDCGAESPVHAKDCRSAAEHDEWNRRRLDAISDPPDPEMMFGRELHFERSPEWEKQNPHPPCTCGADEAWKPRDYHLPNCSPMLPNLAFGDVRVNWYKHLGRGTSTNVDWNEKQWREWFDAVMAAIRAYEDADKLGIPRNRRKHKLPPNA